MRSCPGTGAATVRRHKTRDVQDWLSRHKLDRATLQRLKDNYEGHIAWLEWQRTQYEEDDADTAEDVDAGKPENMDSLAPCGTAGDEASLRSQRETSAAATEDAQKVEGPGGAVDARLASGKNCDRAAARRESMSEGVHAGAGGQVGDQLVPGDTGVVADGRAAAREGDPEVRGAGEPAAPGSGPSTDGDMCEQTVGVNGVACKAEQADGCAGPGNTEVVPAADTEPGKSGAGEEEGPEIVPGQWGVWKARTRAVVPLGSEPGRFSYEFRMVHVLTDVRNMLAQPRRKGEPASWVGRCVRVFWPDDGVWYSADVVAWRPQTGTHMLLYHADDEEEELDLAAEERQRRLQWLNGADSSSWPAPPQPPLPLGRPPVARSNNSGTQPSCAPAGQQPGLQGRPAIVSPTRDARGAVGAGSDAQLATVAGDGDDRSWGAAAGPTATGTPQGDAAPSGEAAIGWRVEVFWEDGDTWCKGLVEAFEQQLNRHKVHFDDGDMQWVDFSICPVQWLKADAGSEAAQERERTAAGAAEAAAEALAKAQAEAAERARTAPDVVDVVCNGRPAQLLVRETAVIMENGNRVSPTEFERLSGKGAAKKWKVRLFGESVSWSPFHMHG